MALVSPKGLGSSRGVPAGRVPGLQNVAFLGIALTNEHSLDEHRTDRFCAVLFLSADSAGGPENNLIELLLLLDSTLVPITVGVTGYPWEHPGTSTQPRPSAVAGFAEGSWITIDQPLTNTVVI